MKLSRESEYALAGLAHLARKKPGTVLTLRSIASAGGLPPVFLAKIFRRLTRAGLLTSHRGGRRGYGLARPPEAISVKEIVEAVEGADVFRRCVFWSNRCSDDRPCILHELWKTVRPQVVEMMESLTLADVARGPLRIAQLAAARPDAAPPRAGGGHPPDAWRPPRGPA
ncbi:MAG: Rrf2 family transcriptional regulator [Armatimonadota bacterium]|nr:Rrf2 family transcriptional regulator [Armatimonadota bacterium]MDR7402172.1 Rrf2 family transcriptional regulator [Armatimonadota bacterium]MDR7436929.1 Rrf2 family transcriptional regulator [Armatimonadota bacterium]MDR7472297.1 Rrf2 family transcriptional regulator [Armatimonadota bacterium]MDR7506400.1 Rrf2 family transcriptional regulator [Armatimonadota bacterium]